MTGRWIVFVVTCWMFAPPGGFLGAAGVRGPGSNAGSASAARSAASLRALVEADWIAQDELKGGGFQLTHTRGVLRRGKKLLSDLQTMTGFREHLLAREAELQKIAARVAAIEARHSVSEDVRREIYFEARRVVRGIAFSNPLLNFDKLLFVKRHPGRFPHMCDQYYGTYARPGGGLFVLENPWTEPRARNVLGNQLPEGSFLSPDLSYDGAEILFAYCRTRREMPAGVRWEPACRGDAEALQSARWTPEACYHIYKVRADGTGLRQLSDGPYDDFDPCWLPDGQIAFISTRRGGFCRCGGRPVPAYTLHRMRADGSDIRRMSHHETNEWHPAVTHDGSVLYTRWDYVDRHTNLAHSLWSCNADGSNPTAIFGNYNWQRKPWGEWHPQPIPASHKFLAIAGAHHGYAYGSVVLIDPSKGLDGLESITRLTPDVAFPEAEGWPDSAFTTPLPLSEKYYLVSYSPRWSTRDATHEVTQGIYLLDSFGNRELVYRDPAISSLGAIPLRARLKPPAWPETDEKAAGAEGEFLVLDVYRSSEPIPSGSIKALRIVQILPKSTFRNDDPRISVARQISARYLLGTVPVEKDGSVHFKAPAGVPLYFQAVDADGLAYQSMRSITYLQPGEKRTCIGCHEPRNTAAPNHAPLAARRPPSEIEPGPDGSKPFSYPRLVQPVLDRHCVRCHNQKEPQGGIVLTGGYTMASGPHSVSYKSLARRHLVHWFDSVNGGEWKPRTYPGRFGARMSKLIEMLRTGHHDVKLDRESLERLAIWIDLNVPFYGAYEPAHVNAQRQGKVVPLSEIMK